MQLRNAYGKRYDGELAQQAEQDVRTLLGEKTEKKLSIQEQLKRAGEHITKQESSKTKKHRNELER